MTKKRKSKSSAAATKTLVRAANGDLYVITQSKIVKLDMNGTGSRVKSILKKAANEVSCEIEEDIPTLASGVNVSITEVFGHDD